MVIRGLAPSPLPLPRSRLRSLRFDALVLDTSWAEAEFGHAQLGDVRRTRRLVRVAARAAHQPVAYITKLFAQEPRALDAAYDFFENDAISPLQLAAAHHQATALRCQGHPYVFLAVDGSSFQFADRSGRRQMGRVGTNAAGAKGIKSMLGLAISPDGVPLGLLGQALWHRGPSAKKHHALRTIEEKETRYWHQVLDQATQTLADHAPDVALWAQLDREGDSWSLLLEAVTQQGSRYTTVRARTDRNLVRDPDGQEDTEPGGKLLAALETQPVEATYALEVSAGPARKARTATMSLRWREVTLALHNKRTRHREPATVFALLAEENGTTPAGEKPVRWLLLTTHPIETVEQACLVLYGYSLRWRIELLHAALKDRGCELEQSQLQDKAHVERFVTVMFAVGVRLIRLVYLARHQPAQPAELELTRHECLALGLEFGFGESDVPSLTVAEAVEMLGKLGGHVGNPAKRPIGFLLVGRGLKELRPLVRLIARGHSS